MSHLPPDLVEEILSRVPTTSLNRLRSICKRWNTLFKDQRFAEKHFRNSAKQPRVLMLKDYKLCSMNVDLNVVPPSLKFKASLDLEDSHSKQINITDVFHCDGLLLCNTYDNKLLIWNPCLGEIKWIQCKTGFKKSPRFALGYKNNKSCLSYTILRYWDWYEYIPKDRVFQFEIYEFSSDSWRVLDDDVSLDNCVLIGNGGVSLKGNTYWLALNQKDKHVLMLLSFDFASERFKHMCLPPSQSGHWMGLSVSGEDKLSVLHQRIVESKMDIWVTNKIEIDHHTETDLMWSKLFTVDTHSFFVPFTMSCLINEEKKVGLCTNTSYSGTSSNIVYIIGQDYVYFTEISFVDSTNKLCLPYIFNYVPSLFQIQQNQEAKEKKQTSRSK